MAEPIKIDLVPKDHSTDKIVKVFNPLSQDFVQRYDGKEKVIPAGKTKAFPENVGVLLAKHLGVLITTGVAMKEREELLKTINDKAEKNREDQKTYPRFAIRAADVAKLLVMDEEETKTPDPSEIEKAASEAGAQGKAGAPDGGKTIDPRKIEFGGSLTAADLKKALKAKGVSFKKNDKKADLEALLAEAIKKEESDKE